MISVKSYQTVELANRNGTYHCCFLWIFLTEVLFLGETVTITWGEYSCGVANACAHPCVTSQTLLLPSQTTQECWNGSWKNNLQHLLLIQTYSAKHFQKDFYVSGHGMFCKLCQHNVLWKRVDMCKGRLVGQSPYNKYYTVHALFCLFEVRVCLHQQIYSYSLINC